MFSTNCYCQKFNVGDTVYYNTNKIVEKCIVTKCYPEELCYDVIGIDSGRKGYFAENKLSKEASRVVSNQVENDNRVVDVNYGDKTAWEDKRLVDESGKAAKFNSMVDALNYMNSQGWEYTDNYLIGNSQSGYVYHFLLKKRVD